MLWTLCLEIGALATFSLPYKFMLAANVMMRYGIGSWRKSMQKIDIGMRPKAGWIIVQPIIEKQTSVIFIPGAHQKKDLATNMVGKVLALEPHKKPDVFDPEPNYGFKVGEHVLFQPFQGTAIPRGKDMAEWFTLPISDVVAVCEE
jgi:co-chaperonin GroES (HSP10)